MPLTSFRLIRKVVRRVWKAILLWSPAIEHNQEMGTHGVLTSTRNLLEYEKIRCIKYD